MWLIDQLVEQHITEAQKNGEFDNLPGNGKKLQLDDDSHVPAELRAAYRLLKNSGYLPPELEMRREAIELNELLAGLEPEDATRDHYARRLALLESKLRQVGRDTGFLRKEYGERLQQRLFGDK